MVYHIQGYLCSEKPTEVMLNSKSQTQLDLWKKQQKRGEKTPKTWRFARGVLLESISIYQCVGTLPGFWRRSVWARCLCWECGLRQITSTLHQQPVTVSALVEYFHPQLFHPRHHISAHTHSLASTALLDWLGCPRVEACAAVQDGFILSTGLSFFWLYKYIIMVEVNGLAVVCILFKWELCFFFLSKLWIYLV